MHLSSIQKADKRVASMIERLGNDEYQRMSPGEYYKYWHAIDMIRQARDYENGTFTVIRGSAPEEVWREEGIHQGQSAITNNGDLYDLLDPDRPETQAFFSDPAYKIATENLFKKSANYIGKEEYEVPAHVGAGNLSWFAAR